MAFTAFPSLNFSQNLREVSERKMGVFRAALRLSQQVLPQRSSTTIPLLSVCHLPFLANGNRTPYCTLIINRHLLPSHSHVTCPLSSLSRPISNVVTARQATKSTRPPKIASCRRICRNKSIDILIPFCHPIFSDRKRNAERCDL